MPVLFGKIREDGNIVVQKTIHTVKGEKVDPNDYLDGYEFSELPENPRPKRGISLTMIFNPQSKEFSWEESKRELNEEEKMSMLLETNIEILEVLRKIEKKV